MRKYILFSFSLLLIISSVNAQSNATKVSESLGNNIQLQEYEFNKNSKSWFIFDSQTVTTLNLIDYNSFEQGGNSINAKSVVLTTGKNNVTMRVSTYGGNQRIIAMANQEFLGIDNNVDSDFIGTVDGAGFIAGIITSGSTVLVLLMYFKKKKNRKRENKSYKVL